MRIPTLLAPAIVLSTVIAAHAGDLKIRFQYAGDPPVPPLIEVDSDAEFCGQHVLTDQRLIVNPDNNGIKNVVLYVYTGRGGSHLPELKQQNKAHVLTIQNCQFEPHILTAQVGDSLKVTSRDPVGHNASFSFLVNAPRGFTSALPVKLDSAEPAPIPVECNIHPWMKAYVVVLDHPFVGVSDENGRLVIEDLPEGDELVFRVFHEAATGTLNQAIVNGSSERWDRNRFRLRIGPGVNDYGTVILSADQLR